MKKLADARKELTLILVFRSNHAAMLQANGKATMMDIPWRNAATNLWNTQNTSFELVKT